MFIAVIASTVEISCDVINVVVVDFFSFEFAKKFHKIQSTDANTHTPTQTHSDSFFFSLFFLNDFLFNQSVIS